MPAALAEKPSQMWMPSVMPSDSASGRPVPPPVVARRRPRVSPATYRRRRLLAAGVLLLAIAAVLVTVQSAEAGTGGGPLAATGAAADGAVSPAGEAVWVVRPGDTLWGIARSIQPHGDIRPLVDRLAAELGGVDLYPGETVPLDPAAGAGHR